MTISSGEDRRGAQGPLGHSLPHEIGGRPLGGDGEEGGPTEGEGVNPMEQHVNIDLSKIVGTIAGVMLSPYSSFIAQLHADGRITDAEVEQLRQEAESHTARLGELVAERLSRDHNVQTPLPGI